MENRRAGVVRVLAEFAIIFAGVTLGLLADDWRQGQELRAAERTALEEVVADLLADSAQLERIRAGAERWQDAAALVVSWPPGQPPTPELERAVRRGLFRQFYSPVRTAYVGLKDGGQLGLLRDDGVRRQTVEFYETRQPNMVVFEGYSHDAHEDLSYHVQDYHRWTLNDEGVHWPPGPLEAVRPWSEFMADDQTRQVYERIGVVGGNWLVSLDAVQEANAALRSAIQNYLGTAF